MFRQITQLFLTTMFFTIMCVKSEDLPTICTNECADNIENGTSIRNLLLESSKPFGEFLTKGVITEIPDYSFDESCIRVVKILITSQDQADKCFDVVNQLIDKDDYYYAAKGLEILILSVIEGKLVYSEEKFEEYKRVFKVLVANLNLDMNLGFIAGKIIEFISEKQDNTLAAETYARSLIDAARGAINGKDIFYSILHIYCKFHAINGTLDTGVAYIMEITRDMAINPRYLQILACPCPTDCLEVLFDYVGGLESEVIVKICCKMIDVILSNTFTAMSENALTHKNEIIAHVKQILSYCECDDLHEEFDEVDKEEIMKYQKAFESGISGIVELSGKNLASDIARVAYITTALMEPNQALKFLNSVSARLIELGFPEEADKV